MHFYSKYVILLVMKGKISIPYKNGRVKALDYLRGFSIFTIVLMHLIFSYSTNMPAIVSKMSLWGGAGVHVFFLCSGIGLYLSYKKKPLRYFEFLKKRFLKIYIPYIIVVFVSFLIPYMYGGDNRFLALLSHVFLFKMFVPAFETSFGIQLWFISTIIQFYLIFNLLCAVKNKLGDKKFLIGSFIVSVLWWILTFVVGIADERIFGSFFLQYLWEFAFGMVLADKFIHNGKLEIKKKYLYLTAIIGTILYGVLAFSSEVLKIFNDIPSMFGYISIALILYNLSFVKNIFTKMSVYSYELYLVHMLIFAMVFRFVDADLKPFGIIAGILALVISIIVSKIYHKVLSFTKNTA